MRTDQSETESLPAVRASWPQSLRTAIVYCLSAWLVFTIYETVQRIAACYVPVPQGDYWRVAQQLKAYQTFHIGALWQQHNEHRIIFPEIVFAVDMLWGRGRMLWPTVCSFLCYAATWFVLCLTVARDREVPAFNRWCGVLMAGVLAFWQGSALALAQPFLLQWPLMQFGVVLALYFLKKASDTGALADLTVAIAAAVVATYSSANALLLWPLLLALGFALKLSKRFLLVLGGCAIVFVGLYFIGYRFSGQTNLRALFLHPGYFIGFAATYLSMPFGKLFGPSFGVTLGLLNLGVVILSAVWAWRLRILQTSTVVVLLGSYVFTLLTIVITATGRMEPGDDGYTSATATRYLTVPLLNWAAVVLLCYWISARLRSRMVTASGLTFVYALLLIVGTYKLRSWREANEVPFADAQVAAMSLDTGLTDSEMIARIFPAPEFLETFLPPLKSQHLAIFSRHHDDWYGKDQIRFGAVLDTKIAGEITYVAPMERGVQVVGWLNSTDVRDPSPRILLVNELGKVVGWGRRPAASFPPDWISRETPEHEAWVAFANLAIPSRSITAYAVARRGLLAIAGPKMVPALEGASRYDVGGPVAGNTWQMDKTWAPNGIPVLPKWGWIPKTAYSSYQGHDEATGQAVAEFVPPANGCIGVGILHGPSSDGLSAQFIDADTGSLLASLPFRDHDYLWSLWKIKPGPSVKRVRFVAKDDGKDWGQWLAISDPLQCN